MTEPARLEVAGDAAGYFTPADLALMRRNLTVADRLDTPPDLSDEQTTYWTLFASAVRMGMTPGPVGDDDAFRAWARRVRFEDLGDLLRTVAEVEPASDPT